MFLYQGLKMELKVKNLASSDSRGCDLQKEVMVKVTKQGTHEVRRARPHQWTDMSLLRRLPRYSGDFCQLHPGDLDKKPDVL